VFTIRPSFKYASLKSKVQSGQPRAAHHPINPGNLARAYTAAQRSADVPDICFHDLRHTAASMSIRRGDSTKIVANRLGHTNVAFTLNTYVHVFVERRREGAFGINDPRSELDEKTESKSDTKRPEARDSIRKEQPESQIEEQGDEDASDPDGGSFFPLWHCCGTRGFWA
jgi:Phage integrase family